MRKFILSLGVAALVGGALTSCGNGSNASQEDQAFGDSIAVALGQYGAVNQQQMLARMKANMSPEDFAKINKDDFMAGLKSVMEADTAKMSYFQGVQAGLQLMQQITGIAQSTDYPISPKKVYEAFKEVYSLDSVSNPETYMNNIQEVSQKLQERAQAREEKRISESEENKTNIKAGEAYVAKVLKEGYTKAASGIAYKIDNPGTGDKIQPSDKVTINYKGMKTDGTVFDATKDRPYTSSASAFIPGFNEALSMLAKGGKMTVVIPGDQAYGLHGAGSQIGPNETLVFDIEVVDVEAPAAQTAAAPAAKAE
jgi:FKBP-type peptidyl-prolyl cis-trans isomerase